MTRLAIGKFRSLWVQATPVALLQRFCACGRAWLALDLIPRGSGLLRLTLKVDDLEVAVLSTRLRACVSSLPITIPPLSVSRNLAFEVRGAQAYERSAACGRAWAGTMMLFLRGLF